MRIVEQWATRHIGATHTVLVKAELSHIHKGGSLWRCGSRTFLGFCDALLQNKQRSLNDAYGNIFAFSEMLHVSSLLKTVSLLLKCQV